MSDAYVGEIRWFAYANGRTPTGWLPCNGALLPLAEYQLLFVLIGTAYGGDGVSTFGLPDLRGKVPMHYGTGPGLSLRPLGSTAGTEGVTLLATQLGGHTHQIIASSQTATTDTPAMGSTVATIDPSDTFYTSGAGMTQIATLSPLSISSTGNGFPHENCAPTLPINACIAYTGIYPSQS